MIRLLELRTEKGLSQREMAKLMNISQGTYNNWENANTEPSISQLITLADFFDVSVDYLIGIGNTYVPIMQKKYINENEKFLRLFNKLNNETREAVIKILENLN